MNACIKLVCSTFLAFSCSFFSAAYKRSFQQHVPQLYAGPAADASRLGLTSTHVYSQSQASKAQFCSELNYYEQHSSFPLFMQALRRALLLALGFANGPGAGKHALRALHVCLANYCRWPCNATIRAAVLQVATAPLAGIQPSANLLTSVDVIAAPGRTGARKMFGTLRKMSGKQEVKQ
jgi:hypothetical protein